VLVGALAVLALFGGLGAWAVTAPISGAAVAPGVLIASGQNKVVQHLEGGIVREIFVREGDRVNAGEPLLRLDDTEAGTSLTRLAERQIVLRGLEARLAAEQDGKETLELADDTVAQEYRPLLQRVITDQRAEFMARLSRHLDEIGILSKRMAAYEDEIVGLEAQKVAISEQISLLEGELGDLEGLLKQGLTTQDRMLELKRNNASLRGQHAGVSAAIAKARQEISQTEQQIRYTRTVRQEEASAELTTTRSEIQDIENQMRASRQVLSRIIIRSPIDGTVLKLGVTTVGEVIQSGQRLMEVLPADADLIIEARLDPGDVDSVSLGQSARVLLSSLNQRTTPTVDATVAYVSADRLTDERTGQPFFVMRLLFGDVESKGIKRSDLYPGMQVETYVQTGDRTFAEYLLRPILDSFGRAFREE
jgi:HlyD family type I secretion membrane fusion protein